jgi:glycosyltransferase involved in cell wall biosynthesis
MADLFALTNMARSGVRVMVHSRALAQKLTILTKEDSFDYVPYPVKAPEILLEEEKVEIRRTFRAKHGLSEDHQVLLAFGGTRYDKGADLAVKVLNLLPDTFHIFFAGQEQSFTRQFLQGLARRHGVGERIHFDMRFIPDEDMKYYLLGSDAILLPYRRIFSGQSGPLTIGAAWGRPVIAPDLPILSETIKNFSLGTIYKVENLASMANAIQKTFEQPSNLYPSKFLHSHCEIAFTDAVTQSYKKSFSESYQ